MSNQLCQHTFPNGLVLLAEQMHGVRSAAFTLLLPAGAAYDPPELEGTAAMLVDLVTRGAGPRDSRQITTDLDNLGLQRGEGVETKHCSMAAATLSSNLLPALEIYADIVRRPHLPEAEVEPVRALALQELQSLEDEPRQKILVELRRRFFPYPLGRPTMGTREGVERVTHQMLAEHHARVFRPEGAIIGVAGDVNWDELCRGVERLFGDWEAPAPSLVLEEKAAGPQIDHVMQSTTQTQIGLAFRSVPYRDPEYFNAQGAVTLLSGGSSSRLFTEVREKRALCYAVFASYHSTKDMGSIVGYAGTTNERAQETLEVTLAEIERLAEDISQGEVARAKAGLKASLIMQGNRARRARAQLRRTGTISGGCVRSMRCSWRSTR